MDSNFDQDQLMRSPAKTSMKQRLRNAVKMEQEILQETAISYAVAVETETDPASADLALKAAVQVAAQTRGDEVSNFMQDVPAPQIMSGEVVPTAAERGDHEGGWVIRDKLATPHTAAIAASLERSELLSQSYIVDVLALGIDAAESVEAIMAWRRCWSIRWPWRTRPPSNWRIEQCR